MRAIAFIEHEEIRLQSRTGHRCERQYPELAVSPHQVAAARAILDGEIAVLDEKGVSRFHLIQPRIANSDPNTIAHLARSTPVVYFAFDLIYLDGYDLRKVALEERRRLLDAVVSPGGVLRISEAFPGAGEQMLEAAREHGLEGIVAKHATSCYESRRSREWLKIKIVGEQEFLIGGFTEPQGTRDYFGALVLGVYEGGKLLWVGNVGTGFDQKTLAAVHAGLKPLITDRCPFAERPTPDRGITWVRPELVCQVKFAKWTQDAACARPCFWACATTSRRPKWSAKMRRQPSCWARTPGKRPLEIDGRTLKFTNLGKVFYPDEGYTKRDLLNYYDAVADLILPHLKDRPLSLKRYPNGIRQELLFPEERAREASRLAAHGDDRFGARRKAHPLRLRGGPRQPALPGESGLHRPQPVDEPLAAPGQSRFHADRPGPAGVPASTDRGSRAAGEAECWTASAWQVIPRPPAATACTSTFRSSRSTPMKRRAPSPN